VTTMLGSKIVQPGFHGAIVSGSNDLPASALWRARLPRMALTGCGKPRDVENAPIRCILHEDSLMGLVLLTASAVF
jgi:hypothetical protein